MQGLLTLGVCTCGYSFQLRGISLIVKTAYEIKKHLLKH